MHKTRQLSKVKRTIRIAWRHARQFATQHGHRLGKRRRLNRRRIEATCTRCGAVYVGLAATDSDPLGGWAYAGCESGLGPCRGNRRQMAAVKRRAEESKKGGGDA